MRKIIFILTLVIAMSFVVKAQNLVVGFSDPNEVLNINSGSFFYDTVILFNNGTLNISNQTEFVVNDLIAVLGTSELNVEDSYFEVNNIFSTQGYSIVNLQDSLNLSCNLYVSENSSLHIDSAIVAIPMTFKSEYGWRSSNNSLFEITNSSFNLGSGALDGGFSDSTTFTQFNNEYVSTLLPMTFGVGGKAIVSIDSCQGGMELVISENADVTIQDSDFFMIWYTFGDGDMANYEYPISNSVVYPASSNVVGAYSFSDALLNVSGVDFSVDIADTDGVYWGVISRENSDVVVNNSSVLACGFYFDGTAIDTANSFINSQLYTTYNAPFSDRGFALNNSSVNAWNFYPADTSDIIIESCVYGESIGFGEGITRVYNSICDGKGGYFGGMDNSKTYVYNSEVIRESGSAQILNFQDNSLAWFHKSKITGDIVINDNTELYFGNTNYSSVPVVNQNAYFAEAWIDSVANAYSNSIVNVTGKVWGINGLINNSTITRYVLEYSSIDSTGYVSIKDTTALSFNVLNSSLANWNTQGVPVGDYLLWLTIFVDGNSVITCNRQLSIGVAGMNKNDLTNSVSVYPNPVLNIITISGSPKELESVSFYNAVGQKVGPTQMLSSNQNTELFYDVSNLDSGIYFVKTNSTVSKIVKK